MLNFISNVEGHAAFTQNVYMIQEYAFTSMLRIPIHDCLA